MSEITREEVLVRKRERYAQAGKEHKTKILHDLVELFGYHRKAAIRALRSEPAVVAPYVRGRPKEYPPAQLLPPLKAIWLAALQPCGERLKACLNRVAPEGNFLSVFEGVLLGRTDIPSGRTDRAVQLGRGLMSRVETEPRSVQKAISYQLT